MGSVSAALEWVQNIVFLLVAIWAFRRWRRNGTEASRWLAATFLTLTAVIGVSLLTQDMAPSPVTDALAHATVAALTVFPYLLLRFLDSFDPVPPRFCSAATWTTLVVAGVALVLPGLGSEAQPGAPLAPLVLVWLVPFVGLWLVLLPVVAGRFWRGGRGQPTLVRRRLRTLSVATASIGVALMLVVGQAVVGSDSALVSLLVQLVALLSAAAFLVGLAPPGPLKSSWREHEEHQLHRASVQLMAATNPQEVGDLLVPHVRDVVAARAAALLHEGKVLADVGLDAGEVEALRAGDATAPSTSYPLSGGALHVWTNSYTPFFGEDELELLERLAVLADLALARTKLLASERDARIELEAANAELESFVYSASHDLKSPLIAIQSYLDVLAEESADVLDESNRFYIERMRSNAHYMEALVGDLLELSRVGRVETAPEAVAVAELVEEIASEVTDRHPRVRVHVGELPTLWINPLRCRQLFRNLIENAVSHGGTEGLQVWVDAQPSTEVPGGVQVTVRDDGKGVPPEYRERIFGVFERLHADTASGAGTGIGLAICRKITETAGGRIWVADNEGGAEFAILFPPTALGDGVQHDTTEEVPA